MLEHESKNGDDSEPKNIKTYVFGDVHGNALLMLIEAAHAGIVKFDQSLFNEIGQAYNLNWVEKFKHLLDQLTYDYENLLNSKICWVGDILSDRGQNDVMTLYLIKSLHDANVNFDIIMSNHDLDFLRYCTCGKYSLNYSCNRSLRNAIHSGENKISLSYKLLKSGYLEHMKLYAIYEKSNNINCIVTHAPAGGNDVLYNMLKSPQEIPYQKNHNIEEAYNYLRQFKHAFWVRLPGDDDKICYKDLNVQAEVTKLLTEKDASLLIHGHDGKIKAYGDDWITPGADSVFGLNCILGRPGHFINGIPIKYPTEMRQYLEGKLKETPPVTSFLTTEPKQSFELRKHKIDTKNELAMTHCEYQIRKQAVKAYQDAYKLAVKENKHFMGVSSQILLGFGNIYWLKTPRDVEKHVNRTRYYLPWRNADIKNGNHSAAERAKSVFLNTHTEKAA